MTLLNEHAIKQALQREGFHQPISLHILPSIDSTNRYLRDLQTQDSLEVCCAEMQTHGRGRFNRTWFSPYGDNIYISTRWSFKQTTMDLSSLSLLVSIALMRTLELWQLTEHIRIKWPNDLLWQDKKLSGVLIESTHDISGTIFVVIGIGINVNLDPSDKIGLANIDSPWCSLYEICHRKLDRNELIAQLLIQLDHHICQFQNQGFTPFMRLWQQWDYLKGQYVEVTQYNHIISGLALGVTEQGALIIEDEHRHLHYVSSGEASISKLRIG